MNIHWLTRSLRRPALLASLGWALAGALTIASARAQNLQLARAENGPAPGAAHLSIRNEVEHAAARGLKWLQSKQQPSGAWSSDDNPAITALVLLAFLGDPQGGFAADHPDFMARGFKYLTDSVQPNGGIYRKGLANYNTAVSVVALVAANDSKFDPIIRAAHNFLVGEQNDFGVKGKVDNEMDGGFGYGPGTQRSDLSNTMMALEALYYSGKYLSADTSSEMKKLNWPAAIAFIEKCQNLPATNPSPWASDDPANRGGFVYYPGKSMAGEMKLPSGRVALRSYGTMSYAGLLSYIYARLDKHDPRVQAVTDWLQKNYTLDENPGMGQAGLFYYFHTMSKALTAYGADTLTLAGGRTVEWREALATKLFNLQTADGFWTNSNGRWFEKEPVLTSAYSIIALEQIWRGL